MRDTEKRTFKFGDVITIVEHGSRPGVVISAESFNATAMDIVAMTITTKSQHVIRRGAIVIDNWQACGLKDFSIIKPVVFSFPPEDVTYIGHLDEAVKIQLRKSVAAIFGGKVTKN